MNESLKLFIAGSALSAPSVAISEGEAVALVKFNYGIEGSATRLATEKDDTFRITSGEGQNYTLKIANGAENPSEISFQVDLLRHLSIVSPKLPVPRVIADRHDRLHFPYTDSVGKTRQIYLLTYLEGAPLSHVSATAREREQLGEALGMLRLALKDYQHEADSREIAWDIRHLGKLEPLLSEIDDPARRGLLEAGLDRFDRIRARLEGCRTQVLHNDFSKSNIVVKRSDQRFVTGIIDFGDAVRTAIAIDVSTALLNQLPSQECNHFFAHGCEVLRGYLRIAELTHEELSLIPHLIMGRAIARALLTVWRARLFPGNAKYILRNTDQGWHQLRWFMGRPMDAVSAEFLIAASE